MKEIKVYDYELIVENDKVMRAVKLDDNNQRVSAQVYRRQGDAWINIGGQKTVKQVRAGMYDGRYRIF